MWLRRFLLAIMVYCGMAAVQADDVFFEDFSSGSLGQMVGYSVSSHADWEYSSFDTDHFAKMNGFGADMASDDWLMTPEIALPSIENAELVFTTINNFDGGDLEVLISHDYSGSGDPSVATWETLLSASANSDQFSSGGYAKHTSSAMSLQSYASAPAYIAFRYTSTGTGAGEGALWEVVDVKITGDIKTALPLNAALSMTPESTLTTQVVEFEAIVSNGVPPYTYAWALGDGTQSNEPSFSHAYQNAGTYQVVLVVSDSEGTQVQVEKQLTVIAMVETVIPAASGDFRVATFNAYLNRNEEGVLLADLTATEVDPQASAVAEILQRVRPEVVLLNEFDYVADGSAVAAFQNNYLKVSQKGAEVIEYPYVYLAESNTGIPSGFDLNNDGHTGTADDAFGFGAFPGQYGMVLLSRFPILNEGVRTFQKFLWKDMPGALLPEDPADADGDGSTSSWYSDDELTVFRLSSKSHWDIPLDINGQTVHILASHPTPPVFDGDEDRNGRRNHDEIRFWADYIANEDYIYDDQGESGGLAPGSAFVILGDLNASPVEGDATNNPMAMLLDSDAVQGNFAPESAGGQENDPDNVHSIHHTAGWKMRADYVLPSVAKLEVIQGAVFWPASNESLHRLTGLNEVISSDHRLVWADLKTAQASDEEVSDSDSGSLSSLMLLGLAGLWACLRRRRSASAEG